MFYTGLLQYYYPVNGITHVSFTKINWFSQYFKLINRIRDKSSGLFFSLTDRYPINPVKFGATRCVLWSQLSSNVAQVVNILRFIWFGNLRDFSNQEIDLNSVSSLYDVI